MASKTSSQPRTITFDVNPSPETTFHFPSSPSEPGKFDFYRVHLANQGGHRETVYSDTLDVPSLSSAATNTTRRWTPFANAVPSDSAKASVFSNDTSVSSKTTGQLNEPVGSLPSLTGAVKNAMHKGHISVASTSTRSTAYTGTTLSTKDLNHLSPQSM